MTLSERAQAVTQSKKQMLALVVTIILLMALLGYWWYSARFISTDDAYVNANVVEIAPRVSGQVATLNIINNQQVKAGQVLFTIDPVPFRLAVSKAQAELTETEQNVQENTAAVAASTANVAVQEANLAHAQVTAQRTLALVKQHVLSPQNGDDAVADLKTAAATLDLAKAQLEEAQQVLQAAHAQVAVAKASLAQAQLNLQYTTVVAPIGGKITNLTLRAGSQVTALASQFALISNNEYWIDANFKETQLAKVKPGQQVNIKIDVYPGHDFKGVVQSISGGSGQAFSLLPPENATGNWVKVTQRVPVRVEITNVDPAYPLQIGTSATVTIHCHKVI